MKENSEINLAWDFINKTNRNIFLTGKAGTGKTTFLRRIQTESLKRLVVVAPTGVAAINAKGVTIHSFFQLPFGPILPQSSNGENNKQQFKFSGTKVNILRSLDLLIIDEISMVRADLLDGIDSVLRRYKDRDKPFGGVQVLMIGDLQQLAPVIKNEDWHLLKDHYDGPYFFSSHAFKQSNALGIELKHIYRQKDEDFISILNQVRTNTLTEESAGILNARYNPEFQQEKNDGYIILTTHNYRAVDMNEKAFNLLSNKKKVYKAEIEGKFAEHAFPCLQNLSLKVGAQVMFTKNDSSQEKKYFNGKIGEVITLDKDKVIVKCEGNEMIHVSAETWTNLNYSLNSETKEIEENIIGSFTQIPLKLAWAITIHKSQGLTFDKAVIDAGSSFAHGQTYVALSRCKTLDGIVLKTKINDDSIINDLRVTTFTKNVEENLPNENTLSDSEKAYQLSLVEELFNFYPLLYPVNRLADICSKNRNTLSGNLELQIEYIKNTALNHLITTSAKFNHQVKNLSLEIDKPLEDDHLQLRICKAILYYLEYLKEHVEFRVKNLDYKTLNKGVKEDILKQLKLLKEQVSIKLFCLDGLQQKFTTELYLKLRVDAVLRKAKPEKKEEAFVKKTEHTELLKSLWEYRKKCAQALSIEDNRVLSEKILYKICNSLPHTPLQLSRIEGLGKSKTDVYGEDVLKIIVEYSKSKGIDLKPDTKELLRPKEGSSQDVTFKLFLKHKDIREVAKQRDLATSTIESHLVNYIQTGDIQADEIVDKERLEKLLIEVKNYDFEGLSDLKSQLKDDYSYSELKIATLVLYNPKQD